MRCFPVAGSRAIRMRSTHPPRLAGIEEDHSRGFADLDFEQVGGRQYAIRQNKPTGFRPRLEKLRMASVVQQIVVARAEFIEHIAARSVWAPESADAAPVGFEQLSKLV